MKKISFLTLLTIICGCSIKPSKVVPFGFISEPNISERPFQVIFAEGAHKLGGTTPCESLELLSVRDTIIIETEGYLILAHYSGKFFDLDGDTSISIAELSKEVAQQLNIDPSKVKYRTDIELLFSDKRKNPYYPGAVLRCTSHPFAFISPMNLTTEVSAYKPEICIAWGSNLADVPDTLNLRIVNIFDEILAEIEVTGNERSLNLSDYEFEEDFLILRVEDRRNHLARSDNIGIKVGQQYFYTPWTCDLISPIQALEMAYYLESNRYYFDATDYYKLAAELSDRTIFDQLLMHNINRK